MESKMIVDKLDVGALSKGSKHTGWLTVATRPDGGDWRLPFLCVRGKQDGPTLVVVAGVHGDEYEGVEAIPQIFGQVDPDSLKGDLLMVPICNMPAYEAILRSSPIDGLNLARVFPGDPDGSITHRIAASVRENLIKQADFFIDLHSGGVTYNIPTLVGYTHDDGELGQRSLEAAKVFGAPILWGHPLPLPEGRTISTAVGLGIPCLYTEAPGGGIARPEDVACFGIGVLNVMKWMDMLPGDPERSPIDYHFVGKGNLDQVVSAPVAGYFRPEVQLLEKVTTGQLVGVIQDFFGKTIHETYADTEGHIIMLRRLHRVRVGDGLVHITTPV
jgi:predicted deacylase